MIYQLGMFDSIGFTIKQAIRTLFGKLAAILYSFIIDEYEVFMYIARAEILDDAFIQQIYTKVGTLLGIFMLFKLMFALINSLVDPTKFNDGKNGFGKIIQRSVISIVLLGITPSIFRAAFDLQRIIIGEDNSGNNVIYKLIIGGNTAPTTSDFGRMMASDLFFSFFKEAEPGSLDLGSYVIEDLDGETKMVNDNYETLKLNISNGIMDFDDTVDYLSLRSEGKYLVKWNELFSIGVALAVIWILISYCIQTAIRVVQLAYLQLVAPVPILSYISDPDGAFKNWIKQCTTTYLDLFIRMAIIYFIVMLSQHVFEIFDEANGLLYESTGLNYNDSATIWVKIFLVIGLLMFGKKVPDLLKDLFPNMGGGAASLGFGLTKPKDVPGYGLAKGAATFGAGAAIGGIAGMASGLRHGEGIRGKLAGMTGGFFRGAASSKTKGNVFKNAQNGMANVRAANARAYEKHHDGSSFWGRRAPIHAERTAAEFDRELELYKSYESAVNDVNSEIDKNSYVQSAIAERDALLNRSANGGAVPTAAEIQAVNDKIKTYRSTALQIEMSKIATGDPTANKSLQSALENAEAIRKKGVQNNYSGFGENDIRLDADEFENNKKTVKAETNNITGAGGSRHKEYTRAKANAQYKHKDK